MDALAHCRRLLAHPVAGYLALVLLVAAVVQGAGRLGMRLLDNLGGAVNAYLGEQATLVGLRGGWHGLNPLLRLDRVEAPSGWAEQVLVEFDWLETLLRNRLTLRRLFVERAQLEVAYVDGRWALAGLGDGPLDFDWASLLNDTDELRFRGLLRVAGVADSGLRVEALGINRNGLHGLDLTLARDSSTAPSPAVGQAADGGQAAQCGAGCALVLHWRERPNRWSLQPSERHLEVAGGLAVPPAYLPWLDLAGGFEVDAHGRWTQRDGAGGGAFDLQIQQGARAGDGARLRTRIEAVSSGNRHAAVLRDARLSQGGLKLELQPIVAQGDGRLVDLWIQELDLGGINQLLLAALDESGAAADWLAGADPKGRIRNVHFRLSADGVAYAATLDGVATAAHRGLPMLRGADGALIGHPRGLVLALNAEAMQAHFADTFTDPWRLNNVQGHIDCWFADGYLGARSTYFRADLQDGSVAGTFALARPPGRFDQRLSLLLSADRLPVPGARIYVPFTLPAGLKQWLDEAPRGGELTDFRLAYQGQVHTQPHDYSRRAALTAGIAEGEVRFHRDWPQIAGANGELTVSGEDVFAHIEAASSLGVKIAASDVHVGRNGAFADIDLNAEAQAPDALAYVRASPLAEWLAFVQPAWSAQGRLGLSGRVFAPLNEQPAADGQEALAADLGIELDDFALAMPNYRLTVADLRGSASYEFPHQLSSAPLAGTLFGHPATLTASAAQGAVNFRIVGQAAAQDVYRLAAMEDPGLAEGTFPFDATLSIPVDGRPPRLTTRTELEGLAILLPGEFGKAADAKRSTLAELNFLDEYVVMDFSHGVVQGWLHVDEAPLRGALGVRRPPPDASPTGDEILISGATEAVDVHEWTQGAGDWEFPAPWRLQDMDVGRVTVETTDFQDVRVQGGFRDGQMALAFDSEHLQGRLRDPGSAPLELHFNAIVLPDYEDEEDPLDAAVMDRLPAADVTIDSILIGEEDFGRWSFAMRPSEEGVAFGNLQVQLKGTAITAPDGVFWRRETDASAAVAHLAMRDLHEVLPQWGYAPSLHSDSAEMSVDGRWPGSPLNVSIENLIGEVSFRAEDGRFVEVESGAGARRIFSLLNFNTIAKRMNFNFKDVVGKGVSFDSIKAKTRLDSGTLTFLEPAKIKGSGSDFKIGGSIDLVAGVMNNNEMIVTLPVDDSLPWYAVYVSLANPVTGLAVLAGQQMLKKQIKQFSSAKYEVSGPWDDPEVKLVGIWDDNMQTFNELPNAPGAAQEGG